MANLKSSKKDVGRSRARGLRNKARMSEVKTLTKKVLACVSDGQMDDAMDAFRLVQSKIARSSGKGVLKKNTAARRIAKLAKCLKVVATPQKKDQ